MTKEIDPAERIRDLEQRLASIGAMLPDFQRGLAALFVEPPYPRAAALAVMRALADRAGHAARCGSARCRRAGACRGGDLDAQDGPPCMARRTGAEAARIEGVQWGIAAAWQDETLRAERLRALLPAVKEAKQR